MRTDRICLAWNIRSLVVTILLAVTLPTALAQAPTGLVVAYGFNEGQGTSAADASANKLNGTVSSATWVAGKYGNALQFTGASGSRVTVASNALLQLTTAFTMSAWVYPQANQVSEPTIIAKEISGNLPYVLYAKGPGAGPNAYTYIGGTYQSATTPATLVANTWAHVAATYNGAALNLYVNGVLVASTAMSGNLAAGTGALRIGNNAVFGGEGFAGRIDEVRVYNRALTIAEIQSDMNTAIGTSTPPPDTMPPTGSVVINGGAATTSQSAVTLTLAATDNASGVIDMRFSNDGATYSSPVAYATTAAWTLSAGDGTKTVYAQFRDGAGNWSAAATDSIGLATPPPPDTTPPSGTILINGGAATTNQVAVTLSLSATDDASGVAQMRFSNDGITYGAAIAFAASASWNLTVGDGTKTVYAQFKDSAGNWSLAAIDTIDLATAPPPDTTPPVGTIQINGGATTVGQTSVTLTPSATDNATGVVQMRFSNDGLSYAPAVAYATSAPWTLLSGDGTKSVYVQFRDGAGNWSAAASDAIDLNTAPPPDTTPPNGAVQINGGAVTTNQLAVTLSLAATDNASGVADMRFSNDGTNFSSPVFFASSVSWNLAGGDGNKTVYAQFRDGAGNWSAVVSSTILLDTSPPSGTLQINGGASTTTQAAVTLNLSATDGLTGVAAMRFSNDGATYSAPVAMTATTAWTLSAGDGNKSVYAQFRDGAGNWSSASVATVLLDSAAPAGSVQINGGAALATQAVVTLSLVAMDNATGVTEMRFSNDGVNFSTPATFAASAAWNLGPGDGAKTVYAQFRDGAGNWSASTGALITLDTTPPTGTVQINGGSGTTNQVAVTLTLSASDNTTGVTQMRFSNDGATYAAPVAYAGSANWTLTSGDGTKTVYAQFRDGAGNWSSAASASIVLNTAPPPDTTPPSGTVLINGGAATTNQVAVTLTLSATDNATGVAQMRFSNDGVTYGAALAYATSSAWTLTTGDGIKTVYAQFRDGAGNWSTGVTTTISLTTASSLVPQLAAHVLYSQNEAVGTNPAIASPITTQVGGSTLLALGMGWIQNYSAPIDNYGNTWIAVSGPNLYYSPEFYTGVWVVASAVGGTAHALQFDKRAYPGGEISMAMIEVLRAGAVDLVYRWAPASNPSPGSITTTGPATLIAVWGGDSSALDHTAVPDNGFTVIDSYLDFGTNGESGIQVAIAVKDVPAAGTYTVNWASTPSQGCACYLIAVRNPSQTPPSDTTPPTGTVQINGGSGTTNQVAVTLTLSASDNATGVTQMRFSNDGATYAAPVAYAGSANWTLTSGDGTKTVYAQFRDGAGNWSSAASASTVLNTAPPPDTTPPSGTVLINGGAATTNQVAVTLTLSATDNATGVAQMRFSNDGVTYGAALAYATSSAWTLTPGDGIKTVYAQFRDGAGNWSTAALDTINLNTAPPPDTTPPTGTVLVNGGAATTSQTVVTLTLSATDNATGVAQMRFSNDGANYAAAVAYATTASWTLAAGDGPKTVFAQFRDGAGNWSAATSDGISLVTQTAGGPILALGFNEGQGTTTADISGNGLTGTVSNSTWVVGKYGNALKFKGTSTSRVTIAASPLLQLTNAFTMAAWVNPTSSQPSEPTLIAKEVTGNLSYVLYAAGSGGVGPNVYALASGAYQHVDAPSAIPANAWSYVAATYDGTILAIYINGLLVKSAAVTGTLAGGSGALRIGNNAVFGGEGFVGSIDEVRIYGRALPAAEIQSIMVTPVAP